MKVDHFPQYQSFLSARYTIAFRDRDFVEWHGGIDKYGFWAIEVDDLGWEKAYNCAREYLSSYLYPGYQRAPHITIVPCGLLDSNHFSEIHLKSQIAVITRAQLKDFSLHAGPLDSFVSTPYISIVDPTGSLDTIRVLLQQTIREDNVGKYVPHVTLGHYHDEFETAEVAHHFQRFTNLPCEPLVVKELVFCALKIRAPLKCMSGCL